MLPELSIEDDVKTLMFLFDAHRLQRESFLSHPLQVRRIGKLREDEQTKNEHNKCY